MVSAKLDLKGKRTLVTGGASGIGKAIAQTLAARGCQITILDRNESDGQKVAESIGGTFRLLDVTDRTACWDLVQEIESKNPIDLLVCCAGIVRPCGIFGFPGADDSPADAYHSVLDEYSKEHAVNVLGYLHMVTAVAVQMRKRNSGGICLIGSGAGDVGLYERFPYCVTKGAVHQIVRAAACDFTKSGATGLRIFGVAPARVLTPLMENNLSKIENTKGKEAREIEFAAYGSSQFEHRVLSPQEVADLVAFQLEANNTSGEILAVGGWKGQPW
jgi:2-keto-3-deoxy-L-fuconate dehydrogenase